MISEMRRERCVSAVWLVVFLTLSVGTSWGQDRQPPDRAEPSGGIPRLGLPDRLGLGLQIESVRIWNGYSSNAVPFNAGLRSLVGSPDFSAPGMEYGGDLTLSWRRAKPRSGLSVVYQPSFVGRTQFSEWNSLNHFLVVDGTRRVSPKLNLNLQSTATLFGFEQFFFDSPVLRSVDAPPGSFSDLVGRAEEGAFSDQEIASLLTGSPVVESPGGQDLSLTRTFSMDVSFSAQYRKSPRLTVQLGASANEFRFISGREVGGTGDDRSFFDGGRSVSVTADVAYQASHKTLVGSTVAVTRTNNRLVGRVDYASTLGRVRRQLTRTWQGGVEIGAGTARINGLGGAGQTGGTWLGGGDLARNGRNHSVQVSIRKDVGDPYALGAASTVATRAMWGWTLPGRQWYAHTELNRSSSRIRRLQLTNLPELVLWTYRTGVTRRLNRHTLARTEYFYGSYSSQIVGLFGNLNRHSVVVSLLLTPQGATEISTGTR